MRPQNGRRGNFTKWLSAHPTGLALCMTSSSIFGLIHIGVVLFCQCLFCPSENVEHCFALPMCSCTSVHALFYWYLLCDPRRCDNSRKVQAPRRVSAWGAPHVVTWTKQTWIKHHNTLYTTYYFVGITLLRMEGSETGEAETVTGHLSMRCFFCVSLANISFFLRSNRISPIFLPWYR